MFGKMTGRSNLILNLVVITATLALGHALSAQTPNITYRGCSPPSRSCISFSNSRCILAF
jgi:hypothetical protein